MTSKHKDYGSIESLKRKRARMYARCVGGGILLGLGLTPLMLWRADRLASSFRDYFYTALSLCVVCAGIGYLFYMSARGIMSSQRFLSRKMREARQELEISDYSGTDKITKGLGILSIAALLVFVVGIGIFQRREIIESAKGTRPIWPNMAFALGLAVTTLGIHQILIMFGIRKSKRYIGEDEIFVQITRLLTIALAVLGYLASMVCGLFFKPARPTEVDSLIYGLVAGILVMLGPIIMCIEADRTRGEEELHPAQVIALGLVLPIGIVVGALLILYQGIA